MPTFRVLITDFAWENLDIETTELAAVDAEIVSPPSHDEATLIAHAGDVDAIMTCWAKVTAPVVAAAPRCRIVSRLGIGLDNIDVTYCTQHQIPVTNVPDYCLTEVAEHALACVMALGRRIAFYHHATKAGLYQLRAGATLRRMEGQTLGIVGFGNIGKKLAEKAQALGLRILVTTRSKREPIPDIEFCSLPELLVRSDYVSLHTPLTNETRHMMGADQFSLMRPSAYLINTARGGLVDQEALTAALQQGRLAGAALDVQDPEPPDLSQAPFNDPRVIVTPHAAFVSLESLENLRRRAARQVVARLRGELPENIVNPVGFR